MLGWRERAACLGMSTELFFPAGSTGKAIDQADEAKLVCAGCPVRRQCLEYAIGTGQEGIWGATTEDERRSLRRAQQRRRGR
jgi:WhiB family transcriptional regulator, redox-sensing transcriptional regulator